MLKTTGKADIYTDFKGTAELRNQARQDPKAALKETSRQFESLFIQMALKSMRQAGTKSGLIDDQHAKTYQDLYDQQLAVELGKRSKLGIADMLVKRLGGATPAASNSLNGKDLGAYRATASPRLPSAAYELAVTKARAAQASTTTSAPPQTGFTSRDEFLNSLWPHAQKAAADIGVDPKLLLAQAALETGWGKSLHHQSGGNNLFGIKADSRWNGHKVTSGTLEFVDGIPTRTRSAFRAYGSYADSFQDYVDFLKNNPRYQQALQHADNPQRFIAHLQQAGYATDPGYARKVMAIYQNDAFDRLPSSAV